MSQNRIQPTIMTKDWLNKLHNTINRYIMNLKILKNTELENMCNYMNIEKSISKQNEDELVMKTKPLY